MYGGLILWWDRLRVLCRWPNLFVVSFPPRMLLRVVKFGEATITANLGGFQG